MDTTEAHEILGIPKGAPAAEVRRVYRKLALAYHPDRNPGDAESERRFKDVVIAYETLKNPGLSRREAGGAAGDARTERGPFTEQWEEIFSQIFRNSRTEAATGRTPEQGGDLQAQIEVTLEEVASGASREIGISRWTRCRSCRGRGVDGRAEAVECPLCRGQGEVHFKRGLADVSIPCSTCEGRGRYVREKCGACGGKRRTKAKEKIRVKVPAAVDDSTQLKVKGKGDEGADGDAGDLYVTVRVRKHPIFGREGNHILFDLPITFPQAALGDEVVVPTLNGQVKMHIPAGTQSGRLFRLRGKGLSPAGGRGAGDQHVRVQIETPTRLNERQRRLLEEFQRISTPSTNPKLRRFLDKVRSFLR